MVLAEIVAPAVRPCFTCDDWNQRHLPVLALSCLMMSLGLQLQTDLQLIRGDIAAVEARRHQLQHLRERAEAMAARAAAGSDQPPSVDPREWGLAGKAVALAGMRARMKIQPHVLGPKRGRDASEVQLLDAKEAVQRGPDAAEGVAQAGGREGPTDAALAAATVAKKRRVFAHVSSSPSDVPATTHMSRVPPVPRPSPGMTFSAPWIRPLGHTAMAVVSWPA